MPVSTRTVPLPMTPSTETAMGVALHSGTPGRDAGLGGELDEGEAARALGRHAEMHALRVTM